MPPSAADRWFLSFDCATKSFAFALVRVRPPGADIHQKACEIREAISAATSYSDFEAVLALSRGLESATRALFHLSAGGADDLAPGKNDKKVSTVERVAAAVTYLDGPVARALQAAEAEGCPPPDSPSLNVAVEYQMGPNAPARTIAIVLLTRFSAANSFLVGPAYKNKLWYPSRPDLRHCLYIEKYHKLYTANKNHSKDLYFNHIGPVFGHELGPVWPGISLQMRKDFADCVTQVLGFLAFGDIEHASEKF